MTVPTPRSSALAARYRLERELGQGDVATRQGLEVTTQAFFKRANRPRRWDLASGGDRFLMVSWTEEVFDVGVNLRVITHFFDEIRRRTVVP